MSSNGERSRFENVTITGTSSWGTAPSTSTTSRVQTRQRTRSTDSLWPFYQALRRRRGTRWDQPAMRRWLSRQDLGNGFMTEKCSIESSIDWLSIQGIYNTLPYSIVSQGPVLLAGFSSANGFRTETEVSNENQIMFGLGGTAINIVRPLKPTINLSETIGELRNVKAWPQLMGSFIERSYTLRQLFRNSGQEYLNAQFGWAPLMRDVQALAGVVLETRAALHQYERELDRLVRRRYQFDTDISTVEGLSKTLSSSSYELTSGTPYGGKSYFGTRSMTVSPVEITRTVTKSYFSGAFRIYDPELPWLDQNLTEFEAKANALLGTRLDPEVLWNLQPWSWLADYVFNFGDILSNVSAWSDGIVMQYGYLMRESDSTKEIQFPLGLFRRTGLTTWTQATRPLLVTSRAHVKTRVAASPFGFGFNPDSFTESQWAILLALGMSKGLK
jgi:hypothetical protein